MTTSVKPRSKRSTLMTRDLVSGASDLYELADRHSVNRARMAAWVSRPRQAAMIAAIEKLADQRTSLILATGRAEAAKALVRLATSTTDGRDVIRKACLDLINMDLNGSDEQPTPTESTESDTVSVASAFSKLEAMAESPVTSQDADGAD